jgi:hypothetical protein
MSLEGEGSHASDQWDSRKFVPYTVDVLSPNDNVGGAQPFTPMSISCRHQIWHSQLEYDRGASWNDWGVHSCADNRCCTQTSQMCRDIERLQHRPRRGS